jgi:nucleoside-diphosphate-sugar epimerase
LSTGRWLVTGATGFLGRHLLEHIAQSAGADAVVALVRSREAWEAQPWTRGLSGVRTLVGAVTDAERWDADPLLRDLAGVVHLAALVRHSRHGAEATYTATVGGTAAMARLAARCGGRMVFVSTSGTVGCFRTPGESAGEDAPYAEREVRRWPYYHSKILAEREAARLVSGATGELVVVRPPVLLGPGDHRHRSTGHLIRWLRGRLPFLVHGGMHFADVRDVAAALGRVMAMPAPRPVYHLPGTATSIEEFFAMAAREARRAPPRLVVPWRPAWVLAALAGPLHLLPDPVVVEMASHWWGLHSLYAADELQYRSRPGQETLHDTIAWLLAEPGLTR